MTFGGEGASTDVYIPHLFGPGTPVLVPGFQWDGVQDPSFFARCRRAIKNRDTQLGLVSTGGGRGGRLDGIIRRASHQSPGKVFAMSVRMLLRQGWMGKQESAW